MDNKLLGLVLLLLGIVLILVSLSFTLEFMARGSELHKTCSLSPEVCPFLVPPWQGFFSVGIGIALMAIGIFLFRKPAMQDAPIRMLDPKKVEDTMNSLEGDEKAVYQFISQENGMMFQSKLIERTGFTKVKVSRILDSMEAKGLLERRRRGMTNIVVLK